MVLFAMVSRLLLGAKSASRALAPLAGWAAALLLADTFYGIQQVRGVFQDGSWPFYAYLASYLFLGVAALHPAMRDVAARLEHAHAGVWVRLVALGLCGLVVPAVVVDLVSHGARVQPIVLTYASAVMFILLMLRVGDLLAKIVATGRREHGRLQQFLEAIPVSVDVRDVDTDEPAYVNLVATSILEYDPGRVASPDRLPNLYASGTDEAFPPQRHPLAGARQGQVASVDDIEVEVDTQRRHLRVVATSIRDWDQIRYVLTAFADITTERRMTEEMRRSVVIDELTGVNNRRGFLLAARTELARAQQEHRPRLLLFIDLDGLKTINDTYGHGVGDHALTSAAWLRRASGRSRDVLGRIGGDEFCVLLTDGSTPTDAEVWLGRLRGRVAQHNGSTRQLYRLAFTVGQTVFDPDDPGTVEELIARADAAMYQARQQDHGQHSGGLSDSRREGKQVVAPGQPARRAPSCHECKKLGRGEPWPVQSRRSRPYAIGG
jgi:diguanylate cyclase (GGDEF)-like protein